MLMMQSELANLGGLAEVSAGHPIRGAVREIPGGDVAVVQLKNVQADVPIDWSSVARTLLPDGRRDPDWLKPGDVIFSARGHRNIAAFIDNPPARAVCSPHFFLLRTRRDRVLPEFLAWQINLPEAQRYLAQSAEGSNIPSIRRQVLEAMPIRLPSLERQRILARLADAARREKQLLAQLIQNRERELDLVARDLLA